MAGASSQLLKGAVWTVGVVMVRSWSGLAVLVVVACSPVVWAQAPEEGEKRDNPLVGVVNGSLEEDYEAVGALIYEGEILCTGTLIEEDVVLTAAHCFGDGVKPSEVSFFVGADLSRREDGELFLAANAQIHPKYDAQEVVNDIALVVLREETGVLPIPYRKRKLGKAFVGRGLLYVGYGATSALGEGAGLRRSVKIPTHKVDKKTIEFEDFFDKNTCFGDSGGPAIDVEGDEPQVVGVTSHGDFLCALAGVSTRVDAFDDFIQASIRKGRKQGVSKGTPLPATQSDEDEFADDECCGCATAPGVPSEGLAVCLVCLGVLIAGRRW